MHHFNGIWARPGRSSIPFSHFGELDNRITRMSWVSHELSVLTKRTGWNKVTHQALAIQPEYFNKGEPPQQILIIVGGCVVPQQEIVRLADVAAEYEYVKKVKCRSCGGVTSASRHGSASKNDQAFREGRCVANTWHDFWKFTCKSCRSIHQLTFEVSDCEVLNQVLDGSIKFGVVPERDEVTKRFAGQLIDHQTVRPKLIRTVLDTLQLDENLEKSIQTPRYLLAMADFLHADLNLTEFFHGYFALCTMLAQKKNRSTDKLTVLIPDEVLTAFQNPKSPDAVAKGLTFLLDG